MDTDDTDRYLSAIRATPRPTEKQMGAFAHFIANAHSWYKHLPLQGAGEPFFVYLTVNPHTVHIKREDGTSVARDVIREQGPRVFYDYRIDLRPGDVDPGKTGPLAYLFGHIGTAEYRQRFGGWTYWNHGRPDQPRVDALAHSARYLRAFDSAVQPMAVPSEVLDRGLVYLRATISGSLGPTEEEYERLRETEGLPDPDDDYAAQLEELVDAMRRVTECVYGPVVV